MEALLLGLWLVVLLLSLGSRRAASVLVVPVVLVVSPDAAQPAQHGEAWLRRQLDGLGKEDPLICYPIARALMLQRRKGRN